MRFSKWSWIALVVLVLVQPVYAQTSETDLGGERDLDRIMRAASAPLVGTWVLDVRNALSPPFQALQTFHAVGTMTETSDLLAAGNEGPGHGAWEREGDTYHVTFELFIFNPDTTPAGIIRVRETMKLSDLNTMSGFAVADIILPDGTLIENIDGGPFTAQRVQVKPVRPEELSFPKNAAIARKRW